jgi:hypothetical protein
LTSRPSKGQGGWVSRRQACGLAVIGVFDMAILDLNLGSYGSGGLKEAYASQQTLQKPFNQEALAQAIRVAFD